MDKSRLVEMDEKADETIANWSFGAFAANVLPPPLDAKAAGTVFAKMGERLAEIYGVVNEVDPQLLENVGTKMAERIGYISSNEDVAPGLKWIPGVNVWVALLIQPKIVAAVAYSVGSAYKEYCHELADNERNLTPEEVGKFAKKALDEKLHGSKLSASL